MHTATTTTAGLMKIEPCRTRRSEENPAVPDVFRTLA